MCNWIKLKQYMAEVRASVVKAAKEAKALRCRAKKDGITASDECEAVKEPPAGEPPAE